uniref:NADH dehydrogenase subunit 4L n=1 Tax=Parakontikia atrata TaxID=2903269 RepID=A0A9E8AEK6_9PLAT|nr:NADH dehydrogenase subunit 4L [Parakontikia atrata]UZA66419.1 NADH dehydrogenase subunit 4L [Parakontikia atrata]
MFGFLFFEFFVVWFFIFHLCFIYFSYFRLLKFLLSVEISLVLLYFISSVFVFRCEVSFLLILLCIVVCESAVGLVLLVGYIRFIDKNSVKSNLFASF